MRYSKQILSALALFLLLNLDILSADNSISVLMRNNVAPPVKHAVNLLETELSKYNYTLKRIIRKDYPPQKGRAVYVGNIENYLNKEQAFKLGFSVPHKQESYILRIKGNKIYIFGSDEIGAMYGLYDLVEQIRWRGSMNDFPKLIKKKTETPFVKIRGVNPFLHTQALWDKNSWFYDMDFWKEYLDQLSFNRFNFLDIHAVYDLYNTDFLNFFAYFVKSDVFPQVGLSQEVCNHNLDVFKEIIRMAKDRGIKTGLMNYNFTSFIGGQPRPGQFRDDPKIALQRLNESDLEDYIRDVTAKFLRETPDLWVFGFRIGESGKRLDFFRDTFIKGIQNAGRKGMPLYSRSWLTTRRLIDKMATDYPGRLYLEIKYNGEHFGPPYQAISAGLRPWHLSYSYEEYSNLPQNFTLLWQIRFNGTHRLFQWADPQYVKRTVNTLHFAHGQGFTIEPMQAYFPWTDFSRNDGADDYYRWGFQRDWLWNRLWGRLSYNPDAGARIYLYDLEQRFGKNAAKDVLTVISNSSEVVPFIFQTHCVGVDHRAFAPEFETGNGIDHHYKPGNAKYDKGVNGFIAVPPLDSSCYMGIDEYVKTSLAGQSCTRRTPLQISRRFDELSTKIHSALSAPSLQSLTGNAEYDNYRINALILADLAAYYSEKFMAATELDFYYHSGDRGKLESALTYLECAYENWRSMSALSESYYRPFSDQLRMRTNDFTWGGQLVYLQSDIDFVNKLLSNTNENGIFSGIGHTPLRRGKPNEDLLITASLFNNIDDEQQLILHYRCGSGKKYRHKIMQYEQGLHLYRSAINRSCTKKSGKIRYYLSTELDGKEIVYPPQGAKNPITIDISADFSAPKLSHHKQFIDKQHKSVAISIEAKDKSGVKSITLFYKALPSYLNWQSISMKKTTTGCYKATVPLTTRGLMYHFAVLDVHDNGAVYPDPQIETPYFVIESWEE